MTIRVHLLRLLATLALPLAAAPLAARERGAPFTLEQVMGSAFPSWLVAAPAAPEGAPGKPGAMTGGKVAWILNAKGARNIWAAEAPDYRGRQLTSYRDDDGQDLGELAWTPDGSALVYTRGGDLEMFREAPNPRSAAEGTEQAIWIVSLAGAEPRKLVEGNSPAVSPKGDHVAFLKKDEIWWAKIDGEPAPEQLVHERGRSRALRWSPDGSKLAFVSSRKEHSFVGVYDVTAKIVRWLDPSVDNDAEPTWSPDGRWIAFIRFPADSKVFDFYPRRSGQPWSIRVAGVDTGAGREVWRAREGRGSVFREVSAENQILWTADDRIVFPWEADGWTHLYSVPALSAGGGRGAAEATLLTPGEFEVEWMASGAGGKEILLASNQGDIERRHVWKVSPSGGPPAAVTSGRGIEWSPVATADGKSVAFLQSDARRPARAAILIDALAGRAGRGGSAEPRDLAPEAIPDDFPETALVEPQPVVFPAADGMEIHAQLFIPPGAGEGRAGRSGEKEGARQPAVIFLHGGSRRQMLLGWHYMDYYHNAYALNQYLASRGFVVLAVNYRSGIGYGMEFREAENYGATGASEFSDVLGAGVYLRGRPDVDSKRIGLWGGSYGGYLTALGLARASDLFAAGVDLHGVHDWNPVIRNFQPDYDPLAHPDAARLAFEASPLASVKRWRSPVLLIHGDDDRNVPFTETVHLAEALREQGVEFEQLVFPDEIHGFLLHSRWLEAYRATADFLERRLRGETTVQQNAR